ncbi:MAG TPA: efflux RND transporter periplasmic adaptor subunit [Ignavibacteriaceae bacterium]|nr:efflux RND transporter periplasmic adaptor subunit [Ignavibacteriaceae bacterium]
MRPLIIKISSYIITVLIIIFFSGCGNKSQEAAKSMEEIQKEEGIPVKVEEVKYKPFHKFISYYSKLTGIKEATKGAMIGGKIEKINARIGDYIKENQVVIQFDIDNPALQYDQAKTSYENSKKNYDRLKTLLEAGETSQANFDGAETQYLVNKRNYESLKQMLFIESPFNGRIVDLKVNEGDNVNKDAYLFTVAQTNKMRAKIWVSEKEIGFIKKGMKTIAVYNGKEYPGKITDVSLGIDPARQSFYAESEFDNAGNELMNGVTVEIKVLVYENPKAIIIPRSLMMVDDKGHFLFTENNGKAVKVYAENGRESGIYYEVNKGLRPGDKLIITGVDQLDDGTAVKVIQ